MSMHLYEFELLCRKDIISLWVEVCHISVPSSKVVDWLTVTVKQSSFGRHDWFQAAVKELGNT